LLEIISKLFQRLTAAHEYFPTTFNVAEIILIISAAEIVLK